MIYSIWNQPARRYDYFTTPDVQKTANTPKPGHIRPASLGATIDQAAWPLPSNARMVGNGAFAKGRVASRSSGLPLGSSDMDMNTLGIIGCSLAAFLLWRNLR